MLDTTMSDVLQRKTGSEKSASVVQPSAFAKRAQEEKRKRAADVAAEAIMEKKRPSFVGRFLLFIGIPSLVGALATLMAYVSKGNEDDAQLIDFDRDFVFPFVVTLVLVVVVGFQTKGFTQDKPKSLLVWPKVKRQRTVVRRTVVVDDDGGEVKIDDASKRISRRSRRSRKED